MTALELQWQDIDPWWDRYVRGQEADLLELREVITDLNAEWAASDCIFDRDPLCEAWEQDDLKSGPLRPNQEENWSHWLAHLIRSSAGEFNRELFGQQFNQAPESVRRERSLRDEEEHDRRVDIIVEFADRAVSIEVKKGDEHYGKTPQTAALTEKHHRRNLEWTHLLLLPKSKIEALQSAFGDSLAESGANRPTITPDKTNQNSISVVYWRDVSRALRRTLINANEPATHWEASAFLFIILIEQKICQFHSPLRVSEYESPGISGLEVIQSIDFREQVDYLATTLGEDDNE